MAPRTLKSYYDDLILEEHHTRLAIEWIDGHEVGLDPDELYPAWKALMALDKIFIDFIYGSIEGEFAIEGNYTIDDVIRILQDDREYIPHVSDEIDIFRGMRSEFQELVRHDFPPLHLVLSTYVKLRNTSKQKRNIAGAQFFRSNGFADDPVILVRPRNRRR